MSTDDDTDITTRTDDEHDTPVIDPRRITKTARKIAHEHPLSPPEPTPPPTAPPEPGEGDDDAPGEDDDETADYLDAIGAA